MAPFLVQYVMDLLFPLPFMGISVAYFVGTFLRHPLLPLSDFSSYQEKVFATFWKQFGPVCAADVPASFPPLLAQSKGVILDVGPGTGEQVHRFSHPENITAIYGVEPGVSMHDKLREAAARAGLGGKYHVLGSTADLDSIVPQLLKAGLINTTTTTTTTQGAATGKELQLFDEIACVRVLCGVPDQRASVADLYTLLKPGGRIVVFEHVLNTTHLVARLAQRLYMLLGWKQLMGGCDLERNTMETFLQVAREKDGGFAKVDVGLVSQYSPTVHVVGVLTKKGKK